MKNSIHNVKITKIAILFCSVILVSLLAVNQKSIWIDESLTMRFITNESISSMFKDLFSFNGSEKQMPLFFIYEWIWANIFGYTELCVRFANIIPLIIYLVYGLRIIEISQQLINKVILVLLLVFNPMIFTYMNEARPYIMLIAISMGLMYYCFYCDINRVKTLCCIHILYIIGITFHMLFLLSIPIYICAIIYRGYSNDLIIPKQVKACLCFIPVYILLILYFFMTFKVSGSVSIGNASGSFIISLIVSMYYILGYGGIGPSRNDLRIMNFQSLTFGNLILFIVLSISILLFLIYILKVAISKDKKTFSSKIIWICIAGIIIIFEFSLLSILFNYSFWERHIIVLSSVLFCFAFEGLGLISGYKRIAPMTIAIAFIFSSINFSINNYYGNEDYKTVLLSISENEVVLAQGYSSIFKYYGYDLVDFDNYSSDNRNIIDISNYSKKQLQTLLNDNPCLKDARIIVTSRTIFDSYGLYNLECDSTLHLVTSYRGLKEYSYQSGGSNNGI